MAVTTEATRLSTLPAPTGRAGLIGTLRSEWTKIRSVRSTYWTCWPAGHQCRDRRRDHGGVAAHWSQTSPADRATFDATATSLAGLFFLGELVIVVLGALTITSEYSTGMIRTSLTSMPRRGVMYLAKAAVMAVVMLVMGTGSRLCRLLARAGAAGEYASRRDAVAAERAACRDRRGPVRHPVRAAGVRHRIDDPAHGGGDHHHGRPCCSSFLSSSTCCRAAWHADVVRWLPSSAGDAITGTVSGAHRIISPPGASSPCSVPTPWPP